MNKASRWIVDLLLPPRCVLCRRFLESSGQTLCGRCSHDLPEHELPVKSVPYIKKTAAPFHYEGLIREAILRYKFESIRAYSRQFAIWMTERIKAELDGMFELITWVPCSRRRKWVRGYDQSELLAKELSVLLQVPCRRLLRKVRHTPKQSRQRDAAARRANVLGAYATIAPEKILGKRILLVDDILTTGATLSECGKMLCMAGADDPVCAVIAAVRQKA